MKINPVVIIPIYKPVLTEYDYISLRHAYRYLSRYRIAAIQPKSLRFFLPGMDLVTFPDHFFRGRDGYNELMLSVEFYEHFQNHSHMLIYQQDALVFRDELEEWCAEEIDYIGACWYPNLIQKYEHMDWPYARIGCGNGGFSLRRIETFLNHLQNRKPIDRQMIDTIAQNNAAGAKLIERYWLHLDPANFMNHESLNEDVYFGIFASILDRKFRVALPEMGDRFSFEYAPQWLFKKNGEHMPFGCHAWYKFPDSLDFWTPYLVQNN